MWGRGPSSAATDCWWTKCIPVRARAAEEERCELPDDIFGEWMPLLICEKRHIWANKWRTVTTAWLCTPAPGWCRHRCLLQPGGRCLGSGLLLLPPTGAPRLMQRLTVPEPGKPPRKQWDREFYRLATVLPVCPVSDLDGMRVVWRKWLNKNNVYFQRGLNRNLTKASRNNFKQISQNSFEKKWVQVDGMRTIKGQIGIARKWQFSDGRVLVGQRP